MGGTPLPEDENAGEDTPHHPLPGSDTPRDAELPDGVRREKGYDPGTEQASSSQS